MTQSPRPTPELLAELRKPRPYPVASVTLPTHRHRPENQQDHIRLRNLLAEASKRLADDPDVPRAQAVAVNRQLTEAADGLDPEHFLDGLVVHASHDENAAYVLGTDVPERIVVGTTYLTRNLVAAAARERPYLALVLSSGEVRLWRGEGERVTEDRDSGFPVITSGVERDGPPNREGDHGANQDCRNMLSDADKLLTPLLQGENGLPVILVGLRQHIATFREVSRHGQALAAEVEVGGLLNATAPELATQLAPARHTLTEADAKGALHALDEARSGRRYASGVQSLWQAAGESRVSLLVVEEGLRVTARPDTVEGAERATLTLLDVGDAEGTRGAEEDIIDSLVETVLGADGKVVFVPDETLKDAGGVAAALRY
ncbi:hypothetical protein [Streptomyces sp. H27-C3]|uniref:baeRF3 domain-containing protein n=1 Tax=Streptomyces sp. H27-C3 TaxID=3046305 RepID=UPI0024B9189C|nr:hypothetical protein [Streptomyces sp. H27-C3]MDJ0466535.1 hypothetical protein [Streptomyces sp. H27-C3]